VSSTARAAEGLLSRFVDREQARAVTGDRARVTRSGNERIKRGEVVGPAGGETGGPHCLAEVYLLLNAA
jgi:hypothetical protein